MLKTVLVGSIIVVLSSCAFAQQISVGEAAAFAMQEASRAYNISSQALTACQQGSASLKAENEQLKAELAKLKAPK